ncbi:hypothetical protein Tco_0272085 [Tanacetum coccineum]
MILMILMMVFKEWAPSAGSNSGGTHGQASSKARSSKYTNASNSLTNNDTSNDRQQGQDVVDSGKMKMANIATPNPFATLGEDEEEEKDVENIYDESKNSNIQNTRASTPAQTVSDV